MKTRPTTNTESRQDGSLPSREQLAMIAASTQRKNPADAVKHALEIWREADKILRDERAAQTQRPFAGIPLPPKFPATLRDFLRLIVNARTPADSIKRFRDFQRQQNRNWLYSQKSERQEVEMQGRTGTQKIAPPTLGPEDEELIERRTAADIESMQTEPFKKMKWLRLALLYNGWWRAVKSNKAKISAKKRLQPA
jgi:hypothetical protein